MNSFQKAAEEESAMSDSVDRRLKKIESRLERMEKSQKNAQESTAKEMKEVKSMCERILQLVSHIPVLLYNRVKQALPLTAPLTLNPTLL